MKRFLVIVGLFLFSLSFAQVITTAEAELEDTVQTVPLLPTLNPPFKVKLAIPSEFAAFKRENDQWTYWGTKEEVLKYFEDRKDLNHPLIRYLILPIKFPIDQINWMILRFELAQNFLHKGVDIGNDKGFSWGKYLVWAFAVNTANKGKQAYAFVAVKDPESWIIVFQLIPRDRNEPDEKDLEFWNRFLSKTAPVSSS